MKEMVRYGVILMVICVVASGLLAGVNSATKGRIIAQAQAEEEASLKEVMPEAERFVPVKPGADVLYYKAYAKDDTLLGCVFKAAGKGYSSVVETMVGMARDGTITAIKIVAQSETPGLGSRVAEPAFTQQFSRQGAGLEGVQAIAGATISSRAVIDSVRKKATEINALIENEK